MRKSAFILLLASVLSLASCNGKNKNQTEEGGKINSVSLSQSEMEVYFGKRSSDITVTVDGEGEFNKAVKLTSDNAEIAEGSFTEVNSTETFKVYGKKLGETVIHVTSLEDETKAASLSVKVKEKEVIVISEIQSVSLDRETKLFKLSDQPIDVTVTVNGRGTYDDSATVTLSENPTVTVDKSEVKNGERIRVSPASLGETTITVTSKQDTNKAATLVVRVDANTPAPQPQTEVVQLDCVRHTLVEGGASFKVSAFAQGGNIAWSWKEDDAETYVHLEDGANNEGAYVTPVAATPDGKKATLVAKVGSETAECEFTVNERPKDIRTFYVSNNGFLGYAEVYFYAWNDFGDEIAAWPGVKLENPVQNTNGEDCYPFTVDILKYTSFKFNDHDTKETEEVLFSQFGGNNNVWFDQEGHAQFAIMQKDEATIRFDNNNVELYNGSTETFTFTCVKGDASYEVMEGEGFIENISIVNGAITVKGKAVGQAVIRVYIEGTEAEDFLHISVLDATGVKEIFFSNNKGWENVYLYAWNDNSNKHEWPGEKLENCVKNSLGEDVYSFHISFSTWKNIILNNGEGQQTVDISLADERFETLNNIYPSSAEVPFDVEFATFAGFSYSVAFVNDEVTVHNDKELNVRVDSNATGVRYNVTSGADKVEIAAHGDDFVKVRYLAEGDAVITATVGDASDTLTVHAVNTVSPDTTETYYFTNNKGWSHVYLYTWNESGNNHDWPGIELTHSQLNAYNEPAFDFELDPEEWMYFIVNNGSEQSVDISLGNPAFATNDNVYLTDKNGEGKYEVGFATFSPATPPAASVEFAEDSVTVYEGVNKLVSVTAQNGSGVAYEVTAGSTYVEIASQSDSLLELRWLAAGTATVTATLGDSSDTLTVTCSADPAPSTLKTYYFTNNKGWTDVYLYAWKGDTGLVAWPGEKLTHSQLNNNSEPVFDFQLDSEDCDGFLVHNGSGTQSVDVLLSNVAFASNDNVYLTDQNGEGKYEVAFATFTPAAPVVSVAFAVDEVTVHDDANETVLVTAENDTGVTYEVTSGATYVSIVNHSDSSVELHFLAEGDAVITATLGTATDTLTVHCLSTAHVHVYDPSTHECACGALDPDYVKVTFSVNYGTVEGQDIYMCGLNNVWDETDRVAMSWTAGNNWVATLTLQKDVEITFKFIMVEGANVTWEKDGSGNERHYTPTTTTTEVMTWGTY